MRLDLRRRLADWLLKGADQVPLVPPQQVGRAMFSDWSTERAIREGLKVSEWVYSCVRRLATAVASVPFFASSRIGEDEWERNDEHPLSNLLARPNPWQSRQKLLERTIYHLYLGGNAVWHLELTGEGVPLHMLALQPDQVKPIPSGQGLELQAFEYRVGTRVFPLKPEEVAHFQFVDPATPFWGLAPLRAAMGTVETDVAAVRWNRIALGNRAVTDGLFAFRHPLTDKQWEAARKQVREQHIGAANAHSPWVLGAEATYTQMSLTPIEMDFLKSRMFNVGSICNVFGVPVVLVSQERTTYNNMATGRRMFWQDTIIPLCADLCDALDLRFVPYWNPESLTDSTQKDLRVSYDASGVPAMQEIWAERVETGKKLFEMGVPFDDLNQRLELGFDAVVGGVLPWGGKEQLAATEPSAKKTVRPALDVKGGTSGPERAALYKAHDNDRARWENTLAGQVSELFDAEGKLVAAAFEADGATAVRGAVDRATDLWTPYLTAAFNAMIAHFGTLAGRRIFNALPKAELAEAELKARKQEEGAWTFPLDDPEVQHFIRTTLAEEITAMSKTTKAALREAIAAGVEANEGAGDIAARIRATYAQWAGKGDSPIDASRSMVIARTEAGTAVNYGHHEGARKVAAETGAEVLKEWISSGDDGRTRAAHLAVDAEIRALDDTFSNGLLHPNQAGAPAEQVINCRCAVAHLVKGVN